MNAGFRKDDQAWKIFKHLGPFALVFGVLVYWGTAYTGEMRTLEVEEFYERADERLRAQSRGHLVSHRMGSATREEQVEDLRKRFGAEGNDLPSFDDDAVNLTVELCEERLPSGVCYGSETRFGVAYAIHVERVGLDTWIAVMAPEEDGHFTRDPLRVVYVMHTSGAKVAWVTSEPLLGPPSWEDDAVIAQLNSFDESDLGERIGEFANEGNIGHLNRIDLARREWRLEVDLGGVDVPFEREIYALTNDEGRLAASWIIGEGEFETGLTRILLVGGVLGLLWAFGRLLLRVFSFTARGIPPLIEAIGKRLKE